MAHSAQLTAHSAQRMAHSAQRTALSLVILVLTACAHPVSMVKPGTGRTLAGPWTIAFTLDSQMVSRPGNPLLEWRRAGDSAIVRGTFEGSAKSETADESGVHGETVTGTMTVDFTPLLGRQMSCYQPGRQQWRAEWNEDHVMIVFTPRAADCGFGGVGDWSGDTIRGVWGETSYLGPVSRGQFVMTRDGTAD